ncbi:MAG: FIST C-terminal domain-containing protein [Pseudohongiella sp.]|nr:FIST C-terminal domain-containing protein [Pseudohongiella sp.]
MSLSRFSLAFTADPSPAAAIALADTAIANGAESLILLACDNNGCHPQQFDDWLGRLSVPICGGVFPQLIHDWKNHDQGYIVVSLPEKAVIYNVPGLSDPAADLNTTIESLLGTGEPPLSMMMLVDGLSSRIGELLDAVYDNLGSSPVYFGGGAGSLSFQSRPCLFSNLGMLVDHAQLVVLPWRFALGVEHGWEKFAGPFVITDSTRNVVHSLDFRPAFEVYRELVEADSGQHFNDDNFFDIAKAYPFGLEKPDGSILVRDPISQDQNDLNCVGEVPSNSLVYLLKGEASNLIRAAATGAAAVPSGTGPAILVDCISRVLFLQNDFLQELDAVMQVLGKRPLLGMLTLGEIANGGDFCLEFYNKTFVLAATVD